MSDMPLIELAPRHKIGLPLANPVLIAAGSGGYGPPYRHLLDLSHFGALVTGPITLRPRRGRSQPRLAETENGLILDTGDQNPGVKKVIQAYGKVWRGLGLPVIAHLPAETPDDLRRTARALDSTGAVAAIELGLPPDAFPDELPGWVEAVRRDCGLPLLLKLPLTGPPDLLETAITLPIDALVLGSPPLGAGTAPDGTTVTGALYGPALFSMTLYQVQHAAGLTDTPLVAVGGIHTVAHVQALRDAGAKAVQLDTVLWVAPKEAEAIVRHFSG